MQQFKLEFISKYNEETPGTASMATILWSFVCNTEDGTQSLIHARQEFYHEATTPPQTANFNLQITLQKTQKSSSRQFSPATQGLRSYFFCTTLFCLGMTHLFEIVPTTAGL